VNMCRPAWLNASGWVAWGGGGGALRSLLMGQCEDSRKYAPSAMVSVNGPSQNRRPGEGSGVQLVDAGSGELAGRVEWAAGGTEA
jgi:hypothetical protein